ncbi:MAG: clostripain-related cysteine peptidase [Synergistetes bacterium]|nr:clostripain-related cysteine peptidase [Synergistota bacterium]
MRLSFFLLLAFLFVFVLYGCGDSGGGSEPLIPKWTVMVFMNDSSSTSRELGGIDLYEMRRVGSSNHVKVLVQRCSSSGRGMVRYFVGEGNLELLNTLPEASPTSPSDLLSFVNWCIENYSAEKYMLVLWERDHSDIWNGLVEWVKLLKVFSSFKSKVDLLVLDSSAKAEIELLNEVKNSVSFVIALQGIMPDDGFDYEQVLQSIVRNPGQGASEIGKAFIDNFKSLYSKRKEVAISMVSLAKLSNLLEGLDKLGNELINFRDVFALWGAIAQTQTYFIKAGESFCFRDLYDFCEKVKGLSLSDSVNSILESLKKTLKEVVLSEWHLSDGIFPLSHGISLYVFSLEGRKDVYETFAIANDAKNWFNFLKTRLTGL